MNPTTYGMITVESSSQYTKIALDSFFKNTDLELLDEFYLIDNDGYWSKHYGDYEFPKGCVIKNSTPKNTSENINQLIRLAIDSQHHLVFLNNDVIFTPNWFNRIKIDDFTLSVAACNQVADYGFPAITNIEDFNGRYSRLNSAAHVFHSNFAKPFETLIMPLFVCRIPLSILTTVGYFDEKFVVGGEDVDYRIRLLKHGYDIKYSSAFLLHFNGKSSWNGPETVSETENRNRNYFTVFTEKWGEDLANLCLITGNPYSIIEKHSLFDLLNDGRYNSMILKVLE